VVYKRYGICVIRDNNYLHLDSELAFEVLLRVSEINIECFGMA
jgi:hypothetical protein